MNYTPQQLFDQAALGIISQDYKAATSYFGNCVLLTDTGLRCAIGHCVTDAMPGEDRSTQANHLLNNSSLEVLATKLQHAHDDTLRRDGAEAWKARMSRIALEYGLDDSVVYYTRGAK